MVGLLFSGGCAPSIDNLKPVINSFLNRSEYDGFDKFIKTNCIVVAADSGADSAVSMGIVPNFVVGDFDSISDRVKKQLDGRAKLEKHSKDKDLSDTQLAYNVLQREGVDTLIIVGGGGGRFDHFLANFYSLFYDMKIDLWITDNDLIYRVENRVGFKIRSNFPVSFFSLSETEVRVKSSGLKWELNDFVFTPGKFSLSNRSESGFFRVNPSGAVAVIGGIDSGLVKLN